MQILDMDENVLEEWISTNEPHMIEAVLTAGATYILRETTAPDGYAIAEDVEFTVNADGSLTEVVMKDAPIPVSSPTPTTPYTPYTPYTPGSPATGDAGNLLAYAMMAVGSLGLMLVFRRKKKED